MDQSISKRQAPTVSTPIETPMTSNPSDTITSMAMDYALLDCFVNFPNLPDVPLPLSYEACAAAQTQDVELQQLLIDQPTRYSRQLLAPNTYVIVHVRQPNDPWKICIPTAELDSTIEWYHTSLGHPGMIRTHDTIALQFYHRNLRRRCEALIGSCDSCQRNKIATRGYGEHPPRDAPFTAWQEVALDLIGPWSFRVGNVLYEFRALTIIDIVTNYCEIIRIDGKSAAHVAQHFQNQWLYRYPRPIRCVYDQGGEFLGHDCPQRLTDWNIGSNTSAVKNPQSNAICERLHQTIGNTLRTRLYHDPPANMADATAIVDSILHAAAYAVRATVHRTLKATPGSLVFNRDMMLDIPFIADLVEITRHRQQLIDQRHYSCECQAHIQGLSTKR